MKKILILSYFFSPCNLTASQRALGWAKHLCEFGYYPIIVTRNWDVEIKKQADISLSSGKDIIHKKEKGYEVYYLPYKGNLKDRIYSKYDNEYATFRKMLSFIELIGQYFSNFFIPFSNLYSFSKSLINQEDIKALIITANPFIQFRFGYLLQKKHQINWIADYRDDWSTDELNKNKGTFDKFLHKLGNKYEKKWVATAKRITSISPYYTKKISALTNVRGETIYNGFFEEELDQSQLPKLFKDITLTYNGTLYPTQNIEVFIKGFKMAVKELSKMKLTLKLIFPGLAYKIDQANRVSTLLRGYEKYYTITERIPRNEVIQIQKRSHMLLMFPHNNIKGIPSSKLYEYLGLRKPILISPTDDDILEQTIIETNSGIICKSANEVCNFLIKLTADYEKLAYEFDFSNSLIYSRRNQTKKLAQLLDSL